MNQMLIGVRKRKTMFLMPILVLGVFVPLLIYHYTIRFGDDIDQVLYNTLTLLHTCLPMMVSWWIVLLYQDFFSREGNELLYYYYSYAMLVKQYAIAVVVYGMVEAAAFIGIIQIVELPFFVLGQLVSETLYIAAMTCLFAFLLLNTGGGLLISVCYCVFLNEFDTMGNFRFLSVFPGPDQFLVWDSGRIRNVLIVTAVFNAAVFLCMKYRRKYH